MFAALSNKTASLHMPVRGLPISVLTAITLVIVSIVPALAQRELCHRFRAELAAFDQRSGSNPGAEAAANRVRVDISRMTSHYQSLGCEGGRFLLFNAPPPPECGAIAARIEQMQSQHARLARRAGGAFDEGRRQHLVVLMNEACRVQAEPILAPGVYETLFGRSRQEPGSQGTEVEEVKEDDEAPRARGGSRAVCVRTCDGYFFPIGNLPSGRENADEICRALCPASDAKAFFMPGGDGAIEQGISTSGESYTALPNASRYQKAFDPSCSCRAPGQSWLQALRSAEDMIERRKSDILVTAQKAEEMSRAHTTSALSSKEKGKESKEKTEQTKRDSERRRAQAAEKAESESVASLGASAPTAGTESAGIGPQNIESQKILSRESGSRTVVTGEDGTKRQIRVVAPDLIAPLKPRL
jgi:hypothetical protein